MNKLLPVGKISKLFGLDGGVLVNLYDTFPSNIDKEEPLFVNLDGLAVPLFAEHFERRGKSGALIRFDDIDTPERASELLGRELSIRQEIGCMDRFEADIKEDGELLPDELVGYVATVAESGCEPVMGTISAFIDDEFNPLWQLIIAGKEVFIPAIDEFIEKIDIDKREISFIVPEGLLGLYLT